LAEAGCDTPALDAELLAAHLLGVDRSRLWMNAARCLSEEEQARLRELLERRCRREPLPYILSEWEFFGLKLEVSPAVLIPRPETETLVEACLGFLYRRDAKGAEAGCGCGAISIAIAHHNPGVRIFATDCSEAALRVARRNVSHHNLTDRITLLHGDLLEPLETVGRGCRPPPHGCLDFIVANLPYIPTAQIPFLPPEVKDWEPREAIDGGPDGLTIIRRLIAQSPCWLQKNGFLALEISPEQAAAVKELLCSRGFTRIQILPDLSGKERVIIAHLSAH